MSSVNLSDQIKVIDSSWKRCHSLGLSPTGPINNLLLTGKDLQTVLKENEYLIKHTTSILEKLYPSIHSSELVTVIVDRNGTIVHKIGKLEIEESLDYMSVGSNW